MQRDFGWSIWKVGVTYLRRSLISRSANSNNETNQQEPLSYSKHRASWMPFLIFGKLPDKAVRRT
jgi:hypothetical protein